MKKLTKYALLLAAMVMGFAFTSCQQDSGDDTPAVKYYTVAFNSMGGTEVKSQTVTSGGKATKPADPTKTATATERYSFENWYTSEDNGTTLSDAAFDFETAITKDITLYAKWNETPLNVILLNVPYVEYSCKNIFERMFAEKSYSESFKEATKFEKASEEPASGVDYVDKSDGYTKLYFWYDEEKTTIFYYLEVGKKIQIIDAIYMFYNLTKITSIETSDFDTSKVTDMRYMFGGCEALTELDVSNFDTSNVTDMSSMFSTCRKLAKLDVSKFDTSKVTNMKFMFFCCEALEKLDVSNFDTSKVTGMTAMFSVCFKLTELDVSNFDTSKVTSMSRMFDDCTKLTELDLSNFDTSNVTHMGSMFCECQVLEKLDVSNFDTSNVTDMYSMFDRCYCLKEVDVSNFDTSKVTGMNSMFRDCKALEKLDVSNFDTSKVTGMKFMFAGCKKLTTIYVSDKFKTTSLEDDSSFFGGSKDMFKDCSTLKGGAGTEYNSDHVNKEYARIDGSTENPGYFTAKTN